MPSPQTSTRPLAKRLPRVEPDAARLTRVVHDRRFAAAFGSALQVEPLAHAPEEPWQHVSLVSAQGQPAGGVLVSGPHPGLAMATAHGALPEGLRQLAAEALFGGALASLSRLGAGELRADALLAAEPPAANGQDMAWCAVRSGAGHVGAFAVSAWPAEMSDRMRAGLRRRASRGGLRRQLCLPGSLALSERPVRRAVLQALQAGDVLLMAAAGPTASEGVSWARWGSDGGRRWAARARVDEHSLTIEGEPRMHDDTLLDEPVAEAGTDGAEDTLNPLDTLEIPVRFEVDTVAVPLSDLESMGPGFVVELKTPLATASIRLVACGRVVGHAELVAVGDRLGARITRMAPQDAVRSVV